jgi:hypothetical protein
MANPVALSSELVDQMLEQSRLEIEKELSEAGPRAVITLSEIMQKTDARDSDRISAASKILDKVMAPPKAETPEHRGPTIVVNIHKLSTGRREALPIAVSDSVMDAIEAGVRPAIGEDFDGE